MLFVLLLELRSPELAVGRKAMLKPCVKLPAGEGASLWGDILEESEGARTSGIKVIESTDPLSECSGRSEGGIVKEERGLC